MNEVKRKMEDGTAVPCTSTYGLTKQKELDMHDDVELAYALSAPWAAGIGTVSSTRSFIGQHTKFDIDYYRIRNSNSYVLPNKSAWNSLIISHLVAMLHYPECLREAKAEIDAVVGKDRMPTFEDQQSLPYLGAFIKETLRYVLGVSCASLVTNVIILDGDS